MDLYTLNDGFIAQDTVDGYVSAIWTERYSTAGDCQLVLPATQENLDKLADGTMLALRGSKEVMQLQTQSIENNTLTVVGNTITEFFNQRVVWYANPTDSTPENRIADYTVTSENLGQFMADVVGKMVIHPVTLGGAYAPADLNWPYEAIAHLSLGSIDTSDAPARWSIPIGPLYDGLAKLASDNGLGISLYLDSADRTAGYSLKFKVYKGVDHSTSGAGRLIRLTPSMDSITALKEIRSIANWKNVVYVYYQGIITKHLADPTQPEPEGFARRVMVTNAAGEPVGHAVTSRVGYAGYPNYTTIEVGPADIAAFREQNAKDALANNNYIRSIDGEATPISDYKFGIDYGMGDIIELESMTGLISKARVTEYIRSEDNTGEKGYPTISVIA